MDDRRPPRRGAAQAGQPGTAFPRRLNAGLGRCTGLAATLLYLLLPAFGSAQFVSICGSAPSGTNDCPWYHVEVILFRSDQAREVTAEALLAEAQPRHTPRLATLLPPVDEPLRPIRTAEVLALWQSAGQAPEWLKVTPGLSVEQERFLLALDGIGRPRHPLSLDFLQELPFLVWVEADDSEDPFADDPDIWRDLEPVTIPMLEPILVIAQPLPELQPELAIVEVPELIGVIPMELAFREVVGAERLLNGEAARLRRARGFEVLAHLSWRQPMARNEPGLAQLIYTADLAESGLAEGELLLGSVTIDLRRFLHAHLDLYFKAAPEAGADDASAGERWIHLQQSRRMRSGELHYLDHPWIGAIIRIERFDGSDVRR